MKFIIGSLGNWHRSWESIKKMVPEADSLGYWGFLMPDHYMWGTKMGGDSTLDSWISLTYLAAVTKSIKLGTLVTPIPFRPPSILAKMVATLDIISNGRTILGVGAGWSQTEFEAYSTWEEPKIRVDKTIEGLKLILALWKEDNATSSLPANFSAKHYSVKNAVLEPKPLQKPHPPLLFGSTGPRMCRLAGKYADICLVPPWLPPDKGAEVKRSVIEEAKRQGRQNGISFADMLREAMSEPSTSPQSVSPRYNSTIYTKGIENIKQSGCEYVIIPMSGPYEIASKIVKDVAQEVMPSFS